MLIDAYHYYLAIVGYAIALSTFGFYVDNSSMASCNVCYKKQATYCLSDRVFCIHFIEALVICFVGFIFWLSSKEVMRDVKGDNLYIGDMITYVVGNKFIFGTIFSLFYQTFLASISNRIIRSFLTKF